MSKLDKLKSLKAQQANNALDLLKDNTDENLFDEMHKETDNVSNSELQNESHGITENQPDIPKTESDEKNTAGITDALKETEPTTTENKVEEIKKNTEKTVENIAGAITETNVEAKTETTEKEPSKNKKENQNKSEESEVYYINPTRQYTTQKAKEGTSKRLTIRVPLELYNDILEISETNRISMSLFARAAIENCLEVDNFNELIWYEPSIVKCQAKDSKFSITGKVRHKDVAGSTKFITTVVKAEDYNKMIDIASEHDQIESLNDLFVIYLNTQLVKINE